MADNDIKFSGATTTSKRDNSDIVSSTKSNGLPAWQQAKDFLDSNWLLSMGSYVLPGIGTARMVDDAVGNFKDGRTLAGLGDVGLAALSVIPGIGQALGITSKAGRGLTGMMKGLRGGAKAEEAAAGGAKGLLREGSYLGNAAKESREAKAALDAARAEGSEYRVAQKNLIDAQDAELKAKRALDRDTIRAKNEALNYNDRAAKYADEEAARVKRATEEAADAYEEAARKQLLEQRAYPHGDQSITGRYEEMVREYPKLRADAAKNIDNVTDSLKQLGWNGGRNVKGAIDNVPSYRGFAMNGIQGSDAAQAKQYIDTILQQEEAIQRLMKFDSKLKPAAVEPERTLARPIVDQNLVSGARDAADKVEDAARILERVYSAPKTGVGALEDAYKNLRSIEDWDAFVEVLSSLLGASRTAAPWARGIIGQSISPLMLQGEQG